MAERSDEANAKLEQELRRGVIVLAALSQLREAQYGYSLRQALAEQGMVVEEGTLYPLLRRLEAQGLLASEWRIEDGPPRRYYTLSAEGKKLYTDLTTSWRNLVGTVERLIGDHAAGEDQSNKKEGRK
jgi:PadR family transcriptional regulator PadR